MNVVAIGALLIVGTILFIIMAIIGTMALTSIKEGMKQEQNPEPVLAKGRLLEGEMIDAREDESGLSRVTVRKADGSIVYGFSSFSVSDLKFLYEGKDNVEIPLEEAPDGRAYQVEADYLEV